MRAVCTVLVSVTAVVGVSAGAGQDWIEFGDETTTRLIADPAIGADDVDEKDYAWGDLDHDGDVDLVVVRKEPFTTAGRRRNVLFMNEGTAEGHAVNGVLVDRTAEFASAADDGGQGFLDETNDRDVVLVDVNGDGWLDIVTATNFGWPPEDLPKTLSHPRVYVNQGAVGGVWQGFIYNEARIPEFPVVPKFSSVAAGDVTGDGHPDLYFVDYGDLEDRLLVNDGQGYFSDQTAVLPPSLVLSGLGQAAAIADLNGDGAAEIVKMNHSDGKIAYNDPDAPGTFGPIVPVGTAPLGVAVGDINNDTLPDLVVVEHGADRYWLNKGNGADGTAEFLAQPLPGPDGYALNSAIVDLDDDGYRDVLIADVDLDLPGCFRRLKVLHNLGSPPNLVFAEDVGNLPVDELQGTFDVAPFDLNGDGLSDLIIGRCSGTQVWVTAACPWDCGGVGDGVVGIVDLLDLLSQWGEAGASCDFGAGAPGVGIEEFLQLLANWGLCP